MASFSTGSSELDALIEELQPQDNVVFLTTSPDDYRPFVQTLVRHVASTNSRLIYVRADGPLDDIIMAHPAPLVIQWDKQQALERFILSIKDIGPYAYYVFDPLANFLPLVGDEQTLRDLFLTLCPRLFNVHSVAYWDLCQRAFSPSTIASIRDCTQIFIRVEPQNALEWRITPLKVWGRYSDAMFQPHRVIWQEDGLHVLPEPIDKQQIDAYTRALAEKNRELAIVRDMLNRRNQELEERNRGLAELNARIAEQSRLFESLRNNLENLRAVLQAGWGIRSSLALEQVQAAITSACARLFPGSLCRLYMTDTNGTVIDRREGPWADEDLGLINCPEIQKARQEVIAKCKTVALQVAPDDNATCNAMLAPIEVRGRYIGTIEVYRRESHLEDDDACLLLGYLASESGIALENAYLYQETDLQREQLRSYIDDVLKNEELNSRQLALDLHDGLVQMIVASYQHLQTAQAWRERDPKREEMETTKGIQILREAIQEARRLISQLRPAGLDDFGLEHALRAYLGELSSANAWDIRFTVDPAWPSLPPTVEASLFRIVQEAATNALKYSKADRLDIHLGVEANHLIVLVKDSGKGFDPSAVKAQPEKGLHVGLIGIQERTRLLGGTFKLQSSAGQGTLITVRIPRAIALAEEERR